MPPYIKAPPGVIRIDTGRQLFVDDFLIDTMAGATRDFHSLAYSDRSPVIKPDRPWEKVSFVLLPTAFFIAHCPLPTTPPPHTHLCLDRAATDY